MTTAATIYGPGYTAPELRPDQLRAASRATDPATSRQAAVTVEANGNAAFHRQLVLDAVRANPGSTSAEIAMMAGIDRHAAARRLPELRRAGILANGENRVCRVCGLSSMTWWVGTP
jgi:CRP-like cAMP-binding protein